MKWLTELPTTIPMAYAVIVLALVAASGLALGGVRIRGVGLGIAGVLFSGILFGHFGAARPINEEILAFVREFGLILFVYTIGMQVGPGFTASLRKNGLPLNLLSVGIVLLGAGLALLLGLIFHIDIAAVAGLFAGATTNTPALGAATEALKSVPGVDPAHAALPGLSYAVVYPFGIIGIILSMILIRRIFGIDPAQESARFEAEQKAGAAPPQRLNLVVENANLDGLALRAVPGTDAFGVVVSRIKRAASQEVEAATLDTVLHLGDVLLAVGSSAALDRFQILVGGASELDLMKVPGSVIYKRLVVTRNEVLGHTVSELALEQLHDVIVTRVQRAGVEVTAVAGLRLQFGDMLQVVGSKEDIEEAARILGNSVKELNAAHLVPVFVGIALGLLLGSYPISIGGMPAPVRLGLAGGPLIAAILLSRIGKIGRLVWYLPATANLFLREFGIVLFLASVGLKSGSHFVDALIHGGGLTWLFCGAVVTFVPLVTVAAIARLGLKMNYVNVCGLLAGSMTDPPALAFANAAIGSETPSVAYAAVYPLTMLVRIIVAQLIVLIFS